MCRGGGVLSPPLMPPDESHRPLSAAHAEPDNRRALTAVTDAATRRAESALGNAGRYVLASHSVIGPGNHDRAHCRRSVRLAGARRSSVQACRSGRYARGHRPDRDECGARAVAVRMLVGVPGPDPMLHRPWLAPRVSSRAGRRLHGIGIRGRYLFAGLLA